eukprot:gene5471-11008_t
MGWKGKNTRDNGNNKRKRDNREIERDDDDRRVFNGVHEGSIPIDQVKAMEEYNARIVQPMNSSKTKYAVCFGYLGSAYQGLQMNPGAISVESILERALLLSGGIQEANYGNLQKISWTRAARTDKGVHAVANCCAMKLTIPFGNQAVYVDQINRFLPSDIRIFAITKVTKRFHAKDMCTHRRYEYLLPTYTCVADSKVNSLLTDARMVQGDIIDAGRPGGYAEPNSIQFLGANALNEVRSKICGFKLDKITLEKLRTAWSHYLGTKRYHNFTSNKLPSENSSQRYITDCFCSDPFIGEVDGIEYVKLTVKGQSFLLNQIRKMVGLVVDVVRGVVLQSAMDLCLSSQNKVNIPMAPGVGLYLGELYFMEYNAKLVRDELHAKERKERIATEKENDNKNDCVDDVQTSAAAAAAASAPSSIAAVSTVGSNNIVISSSSTKVEEGNTNVQKVEKEKVVEEGKDAIAIPNASKVDERENEENEGTDNSFSNVASLEWSKDPNISSSLDTFREKVIWPHIYTEERTNLHFMYYLDYLRITMHDYKIQHQY